jgi:hypothetical protein
VRLPHVVAPLGLAGAPPQVFPVSEKKRNVEKYFKKNVETF